jgi:hypothetical protein
MPWTFSIFDTGNLVGSFSEVAIAYATLDRLARESPETSERLLLVAFDESGTPIDDCIPGGRLTSVPPGAS